MKVLLDENVPRSVRRALPGHKVYTVQDMGWEGVKNGDLLKLIEAERFDVLLTGDKNFSKQQNLTGRNIALVVMSATNWLVVRPHLAKIARAVDQATHGTVQTIQCGMFLRR